MVSTIQDLLHGNLMNGNRHLKIEWKELWIDIKTKYYLLYQSSVLKTYTMAICTSPLIYGRNLSTKL